MLSLPPAGDDEVFIVAEDEEGEEEEMEMKMEEEEMEEDGDDFSLISEMKNNKLRPCWVRLGPS